MAFDIEAARKEGYSDKEILGYLTKNRKFDVSGAQKEGYSESEIVEYLSKSRTDNTEATQDVQVSPSITPEKKEPDFEAMIANAQKPMVNLNAEVSSMKEPETIPETAPDWAKDNPLLFNIASKVYQTSKPTMEMLATIGGALVGTPAGPMGTLLGSGGGYSAVKNLERGIENKLYGKPMPGVVDNLIQSTKDVATGATFEGAGQLVSKGIQKVLSPFGKKITESARVAKEQMKELGVTPKPSDVTQSKTQAQLERVMSSLFGSGRVLHDADVKNIKRLIDIRQEMIDKNISKNTIDDMGVKIKDQIIDFLQKSEKVTADNINSIGDDLLKSLGTKESFENIGKTSQSLLERRSQVMNRYVQNLYTKVAKEIPDEAIIQPKNLKSESQKWLKRLSKNPYADKGILDDLQKAIDNKDGFDWNTLEDMRRMFRDRSVNANVAYQTQTSATKGLTKQGKNYESLVYNNLRKAIESDQTTFSNEYGGKVKVLFDKARLASASLKERFSNQEMVRALKANPEDFIDSVLKPNGTTEIQAVKSGIGQRYFDQVVKPGITKKLIGVDKTEGFIPQTLQNNLNKIGKETLSEIYSPSEIKILNDAVKRSIDLSTKTIQSKTEIDLLKNIVKHDPEGVVKSIFAKGDSKTLTRNFNIINNVIDKESKEQLKYHTTLELFTHGQQIDPMTLGDTEKKLFYFSTKAFRKNIDKYQGIISKYYSKEDMALIEKIANVGHYLQSAERLAANPSGTGQAVGLTAQISTATGMIISGNIPSAAGVMFGPYALAKIYISPIGRRYLTEGFKISGTSARGIELITKMAGIAGINASE